MNNRVGIEAPPLWTYSAAGIAAVLNVDLSAPAPTTPDSAELPDSIPPRIQAAFDFVTIPPDRSDDTARIVRACVEEHWNTGMTTTLIRRRNDLSARLDEMGTDGAARDIKRLINKTRKSLREQRQQDRTQRDAVNTILPGTYAPEVLAVADIPLDNGSALWLPPKYLHDSQMDSLPQVTYLINRVMPRQSIAILSGRDRTFKTFLAVDWSLCMAYGVAWQGHKVEQANTLYLVGEGSYGFGNRMKAWYAENGVTREDGRFFVRNGMINLYRRDSEPLRDLVDVIIRYHIKFIVIDTLSKASAGADENSSEMAKVMELVGTLREIMGDGTILVIAHTQREDKDVRGHSSIEDGSDTVWHVKRKQHSDGKDTNDIRITCDKMKDGPDKHYFDLHATPVKIGEDSLGTPSYSLAITKGVETEKVTADYLTDRQKVLLETLRLHPEGMALARLSEAIDVERNRVDESLDGLVKKGLVKKVGENRGTLYFAILP